MRDSTDGIFPQDKLVTKKWLMLKVGSDEKGHFDEILFNKILQNAQIASFSSWLQRTFLVLMSSEI